MVETSDNTYSDRPVPPHLTTALLALIGYCHDNKKTKAKKTEN